MSKYVDAIYALADRLPDAQIAVFAAGAAEFLLPPYRSYDSAAKYGLLCTQLDAAWQKVAGADGRGAELLPADDLAARVVPDVDTDPSEHANVAQAAALAVVHAVECARTPTRDGLRHACEQIELAAEILSESADAERAYSAALIAMRGLPPDVASQKLEELNKHPPRSQARRRVNATLKRFAAAVTARVIDAADVDVAAFRDEVRGIALSPTTP